VSCEVKFFKGHKKVYTLLCVKEECISESVETMKRYHGFDRVKIINYDTKSRSEILFNEI
jgi:hypothetical protein